METNDNSPPATPPLTAQRFIDITGPPFNAVGDGKTDDYAAIQAAVNSLAGKRGEIVFPTDTTFALGDTVNLPTDKEITLRSQMPE